MSRKDMITRVDGIQRQSFSNITDREITNILRRKTFTSFLPNVDSYDIHIFKHGSKHTQNKLIQKPKSLLEVVDQIVNNDRQKDYGSPVDNFTDAAKIVSVILKKKLKEDLSARDIGMIQVALKLARETSKHKRDNMIDLVGYAYIVDEFIDKRQ